MSYSGNGRQIEGGLRVKKGAHVRASTTVARRRGRGGEGEGGKRVGDKSLIGNILERSSRFSQSQKRRSALKRSSRIQSRQHI